MQNPFSLEVYVQDVIRSRLREAAEDAVAARVPRAPHRLPRPDLAARLRVANGLRALAIKLDPCSACEPALLTATSR